ncbi:hypothetical protein niasHT_008061 [Heterodera trifolii]|uniref:Thioredoxin domain-containing protein n=1 Tax=Heterodera trifolii TaxID=157864 RepID=A0ABD2LZY5_9BILA
MTESVESCSSSNFVSENSNFSSPTGEEDTEGEFYDFNIDKFVQELIDSAIREASCNWAENERRNSTKPVFSSLKSFANLCRTKCHFNLSKMLSFFSLFFCVINLAMLFLRTNQIVREPPPAVPFFRPSNGTVQDLFDGNGFIPDLLMSKSEFVIVMLYAPWDNRCKLFRRSFSDVANAFSIINSVKFVAVNCHYYRGQCKRMYKVHSFPVILALSPYPNGHPILYNQILSEDRLFSWVLHLLNPLQRLHSVDELRSAVLSSDFLVVGHFSLNGLPLPRSYHVFLNSAFKLANFRSSVAFAVVLNRSLALGQMGFESDNQVHMYTFYEDSPSMGLIASTEIQPNNAKSQELADWVKGQIEEKFAAKMVHELELEDLENAGKSDALFRRLSSSSATLVLFSHSLGLRSLSQSQIALRNFVKIFHHCPPFLENLERRSMAEGFFDAPSLGQMLGKNRKTCALSAEQLALCCDRFSKNGENCGKLTLKYSKAEQQNEEDNTEGDISKYGEECSSLSEDHSFRRFCCARAKGNAFAHSVAERPLAHLSWHQRLLCKFDRMLRLRQSETHRQLRAEETLVQLDFGQLNPSRRWLIGAGCRVNKSLGFLTLDKRFGRHFMRKWGILADGDETADKIAIVARDDERIFAMESAEGVTITKLAEFVDGFYNKTLKWTPKNEKIVEPTEEEDEEHFFDLSILQRINRQMFLDRILNTNRPFDAVLFFSGGPSHGPSQTLLHFFHQTQKFFEGFEKSIQFFIIDSSKNSFDWHFDFDHLPTVVFFPAKSLESFVFRAEFALSVPNLLGFIFPRCQPKLRWLLAFSLCRGQCLDRNLQRIGRMVGKAREDIRILRGMIRKMRLKKGVGLRQSVASVRHFQILMKKRRLQRATLLRLSEIVDELRKRQWDESGEDDGRAREGMAKSVILANWLLTINGKFDTGLSP